MSTVSPFVGSPRRLGFLSAQFPTDKDFTHNYTLNYDRILAPYTKTANAILEVGVKKGGSIQMWREYFRAETFVYGMDIDPGVPTFVADGHIKILVRLINAFYRRKTSNTTNCYVRECQINHT